MNRLRVSCDGHPNRIENTIYEEGTDHLTKGLAMLMTLPDSPKRAQQELALQLALGMAYIGSKGYRTDVKTAYTRARELSRQIGKTHQLCRVLGGLAVFHYVQAEYQRARELAEEALCMA